MILRSILALSCSFFMSLPGFALPKLLTPPAIPQLKSEAKKSKLSKIDDSNSCVKLTGDWKGSCTYEVSTGGSETFEQTLKIDQETCSSIDIEKEFFLIGSQSTQENKHDKDSFNTSTSYTFWSDNQKVLNYKIYSTGSNTFNSEETAFNLFNSESIISMQIDEEQKLQYRASFITYVSAGLNANKKSEELKFLGSMKCSFDLVK